MFLDGLSAKLVISKNQPNGDQRLSAYPPTCAIIRARLRVRWPQSATNSREEAHFRAFHFVHMYLPTFAIYAFYDKRKSTSATPSKFKRTMPRGFSETRIHDSIRVPNCFTMCKPFKLWGDEIRSISGFVVYAFCQLFAFSDRQTEESYQS